MKFCKFCGNQLEDDALFCDRCGKQQSSNPAPAPAPQVAPVNTGRPVKKVTPGAAGGMTRVKSSGSGSGFKTKEITIIAVVAILLIGVIIAISLFRSNKAAIDMEKFVSFEASGFDGNGTIRMDVMRDEITDFIEENYEKLEENEVYKIVNSIDVKPSKTEKLSNGEEITIKVKYNTKYLDEKKVKIAKDEWTHKFGENDFEPIKEIDPFDEKYVTVEFSGVAPDVDVRINASQISSDIGTLSYETDYDNGALNVGDSITIKCRNDDDRLLNRGYKLTRKENTYTVRQEDVDQFVSSLDMIDEDTLAVMKKEAEDIINSKAVAEKDVSYVGPKYEGMAILNRKQTSGYYSGDNQVYLIYSIDWTSESDPNTDEGRLTYFEPITTYFPVQFSKVIKYRDGKVVWDNVDKYIRTNDIRSSWYEYLIGYKDSDTMLTEIIRTKTDNYDYILDNGIKLLFDHKKSSASDVEENEEVPEEESESDDEGE